jgi:xanthine dehydrogenase YagR molybdenum-binding subunit
MKPEDVRVMSPFVGGAFGSGLRPQYNVVLAAQAARALKRSVRLVLTRQQMYVLGYRPAVIQQIELGARADGSLDAIAHDAVTVTSQYEDFLSAGDGLVWAALQECARQIHAQARAAHPCDVMRHARAERRIRGLRARMRNGRTGGRSQARSAKAAPAVLL